MEDREVFPGKSLSQLFKDIHDNTVNKRTKINDIIYELRKKINNSEDIAVLAPIIKDYFDVSVKNDDSLVKIATIVQRIIAVEASGKNIGDIGDILSDEEKERILASSRKELEGELAALAEKVQSLPPSPSNAT